MPSDPGLLRLTVSSERDVVAVRQRAREIAAWLGFAGQDQTRIATAASEIARNAFAYAGGGSVDFDIAGGRPQRLLIRVADQGPGIPFLAALLDGSYKSPTGMGIGIMGSRRLMDHFRIVSEPGAGTVVTLGKNLPASAPDITPARLGEVGARLAALPSPATVDELRKQNRELIGALADLQERQEELARTARELEDTNRGVVALYAELDERAEHLRRADETKSRFLSNMSHELRTPLSSIRALANLLLERIDGELSVEQEKQVNFIRKAAEDLSELVDDLLDLAKIESGKVDVRASACQVDDLFGALRGMLKPLLIGASVDLVFEPAAHLPSFATDEAKLSQILRNLIANALKYTERGEVRVSAALDPGGTHLVFTVADTGIGIDPGDQGLIFEEFGQIEHRLQQRIKGTGLGLPLCRKLCALLGGEIHCESVAGVGSTFYASIALHRTPGPLAQADAPASASASASGGAAGGEHLPVLIVEAAPQARLMVDAWLEPTRYRAVYAEHPEQAQALLAHLSPCAIVLDLPPGPHPAWHWLADLKAVPARMAMPIVASADAPDRRRAHALGADVCFSGPLAREDLIHALDTLVGAARGSSASGTIYAVTGDHPAGAAALQPRSSQSNEPSAPS